MIDETKLFKYYPSAKTILDTMDRIGQSLDYFTERINKVPIRPICTPKVQLVQSGVQQSAIPSANECNLVQNSATESAISAIRSAKVVQSSAIALDKVQNCTKEVQPEVQKVQTEWERLGISRRTYYYRKKKGLI